MFAALEVATGGDIRRSLERAEHELAAGRKVFLRALDLLNDPQAMDERGNETVRSILNRAFLARLWLEGDKVVGQQHKEPFDVLAEAYTNLAAKQTHEVPGVRA